MDTGLDINTAQVIQNLQNKVQEIDPVNKVASEHKDFHAAISKYGKAIDKVRYVILMYPKQIFVSIQQLQTALSLNLH